MKLNCSQENLAFALNVVNKAVSVNTTLPVLNNIFIKSEGKKIEFAATNLEIAITYWFEGDIKNEGGITIPSKLITNYVNLLESGNLELKQEENWNLSIKSKKAETKIKGINPEEFPMIPKVEKGEKIKISLKLLNDAINQTVFSTSANVNSSRPALTGILILAEKNELKLVSTDSFRLSEKKIKLNEKVENPVKCIVPAKTIMELGKIIGLVNDKEVEINFSENQILFKIGNIELVSRLIEGAYPDYEKIIPKSNKTVVEIKSQDFIMAVKKVNLFVAETNNNIKLSITNDGKMVLSTDETQTGEGRSEVDVKVNGENNKIALNSQYLLDLLTHCGFSEVIMEIENKLSPAVFHPVKDEGYIHIIMPLKL